MKKILIILITVISMLLIADAVSANDAFVGRFGETVYPLSNNNVEMLSEDIYIDVEVIDSRIRTTVTCTFMFKNSGDAQEVLMGFPAVVKLSPDSLSTEDNVKLHNFTAYMNGDEIEVNEVDGSQYQDTFAYYPSWYVFSVPFKENEEVMMSHTYDIELGGYSDGNYIVGYVLETGATWKNTIGHSRVTFNLPNVLPDGISLDSDHYNLSDFTYANRQLVFEKYDFSPDFNIYVNINAHLMTGFMEDISFPADDIFSLGSTMSGEDLIKLYNSIEKPDKLMETLYVNGLIGLPEQKQPPVISDIVIPGFLSSIDEFSYIDIYIEDNNFDLLSPCQFVLKSQDGSTIIEGPTNPYLFGQYRHPVYYSFNNYGTYIFKCTLYKINLVEGNTYTLDVSCEDEAGHIVNKSFTFIYHESGSTILSSNPATGSFNNYLYLSILSFSIFFMMVLYKKLTKFRNRVMHS
ncbi:MAG: hypothetical protein JXQ23_00355 [Clostridia bacterium]|nr:hypothetical protein [Clostridia bacterium]